MKKIMYTIEYSDPSINNYDYNINPNWIIFDKDENIEALLKRYVSDVNADDINKNYYWRVNEIEI